MEQGTCNADRGEVLKLVDFSEERENWGCEVSREATNPHSPHQRVATLAFQSTQTRARAQACWGGWLPTHYQGCIHRRCGGYAGVSISQSLS